MKNQNDHLFDPTVIGCKSLPGVIMRSSFKNRSNSWFAKLCLSRIGGAGASKWLLSLLFPLLAIPYICC